ncbi:hypothetical protein PagCFBP13532_01030 [Pantoea agglomerans]|nr:hypothetical protein PagCFBP13532_01030 [Pantoea agglomerans]
MINLNKTLSEPLPSDSLNLAGLNIVQVKVMLLFSWDYVFSYALKSLKRIIAAGFSANRVNAKIRHLKLDALTA